MTKDTKIDVDALTAADLAEDMPATDAGKERKGSTGKTESANARVRLTPAQRLEKAQQQRAAVAERLAAAKRAVADADRKGRTRESVLIGIAVMKAIEQNAEHRLYTDRLLNKQINDEGARSFLRSRGWKLEDAA